MIEIRKTVNKADLVEMLSGLIDGNTQDGLGAALEPVRQYLSDLRVTVITMYRGDTEMFTQVVEGLLVESQRAAWRKAHLCDEYFPRDSDEDDCNNMFFCVLKVRPNGGIDDLLNVDGGDSYSTVEGE